MFRREGLSLIYRLHQRIVDREDDKHDTSRRGDVGRVRYNLFELLTIARFASPF